ncbi:MAG TPA: metallopeptidase family protein [Anaeromyxobacteraceae bacterium]|nr:metallopeptidase family protein [Anaeromyxobacteraceae bacterium]
MPGRGENSAEADRLAEDALARLEEEDPAGAIDCARRALERSPQHVVALRALASALAELQRFEEAEETYERALTVAPRDLDLLADASDFYLYFDDADDGAVRSLELATRGGKLARRAKDGELARTFDLLAGHAELELGEAAAALSFFEKALDPACPDGAEGRALALFELCRFERAREELLKLAEAEPGRARVNHTLGLIAERAGRGEEAGRAFARARELDPEAYPEPVTLSSKAFDAAVEAALAALPAPLRGYLANVAITVEDLPSEDDLVASDPPLSPGILGLFRGTPVGEKASPDPWSQFPSSIVLYQKNLERFAKDRSELVREIGVTLVHEVGHFLGLDEQALWERGLD